MGKIKTNLTVSSESNRTKVIFQDYLQKVYNEKKDEIHQFIRNTQDEIVKNTVKLNVEHSNTQKIKIDLSDEQRCMLLEEIDLRDKLLSELKTKVLEGDKYEFFRLEFEDAVLFFPTALKIFEKNEEMLSNLLPEVNAWEINIFSVEHGGKNKFIHHDTEDYSFHYRETMQSKLYSESSVVVHVALSAIKSEKDAPVIVYEHANPSIQSFSHHYSYALNHPTTTETEKNLLNTAYYLLKTTRNPKEALNYIRLASHEKEYNCTFNGSHGYYWPLEVGEAIIFDAYNYHGSHLVNEGGKRYSLAIRGYSKINKPSNYKEMMHDQLMKNREEKLGIIKMFGYKNEEDFLRTIFMNEYEKYKHVNIEDLLNNPLLGAMPFGTRESSLLHNINGLKNHYKRVDDFLKDPKLDKESIDYLSSVMGKK